MPEVPLLGQAPAETPPEQEFIEAQSAFLVYRTAEGQVVLTPNINAAITVERQPTMNEIYSACTVITKDITTQETAQTMVAFMNAAAQRAMSDQQNTQIMQQLQKGPKIAR